MKKIIEVLKDEENDRYIFLHIDQTKENDYADGIYGINFHQGLDTIIWEYSDSNIYLTEIWRRITLNYPNVSRTFLIGKAIDLYVDAYISQKIY